MSDFSNIAEKYHFENDVTFGGEMGIPDDTVGNAQIKSTDPIDAEKVEMQIVKHSVQEEGAALIAIKEIVHIFRKAGEVVSIDASFGSVVPDDTEVITIDVVKHTGAVTDDVMTNPIVLDSGNAVYTPESDAGLDGTGKLAAIGDILTVDVTRAGAEVDARGLCVAVTIREVS